jgi:glycosyltransferase involved in cell wall biosynthesis
MAKRLLVFETHPIQYRAPIFQAMEALAPGQFEVIYASDFSVRGYTDAGFGAKVAWDTPLLAGYPHRVLNNESERRDAHWSGLTARGIDRLIGEQRPAAVMLSSMAYVFNWAAYWGALRRGIPVWIRMETQDEALPRGPLKGLLRGIVYRVMYAGVAKAFYIGELSREHLRRHGIPDSRLAPAHYCTPDPMAALSADEKARRRAELRAALGFAPDCTVVAFFGKLIPKKDPLIIPRAVARLQAESPRPMAILVVGAGELEAAMREQAQALEAKTGVRTVFAGFINQTRLPDYYLASDIVVLGSHRMGETWGLVVNEALQAGCAAAVSNAVGCHRNFAGLERFRIFPIGDEVALARALGELSSFPRSFGWAAAAMKDYSTETAAQGIVQALRELAPIAA